MAFAVQVVQFYTNSVSIDPERLPYKLNSLLPPAIRVQWMSQTAPDFNVTVSAVRKVREPVAAAAGITGGGVTCMLPSPLEPFGGS